MIRFFDGRPLILGEGFFGRNRLTNADAVIGRNAPRDGRFDVVGLESLHVVEFGIGVAGDGFPPRDRFVPIGGLRRAFTALEVVESNLVGIDVAAARAAFDGHVAHRHAFFHRHGGERTASEFVRETDSTFGGKLAQNEEDDVLGINAGLQFTVDLDLAHFEPRHRQRLRRQHVAHLAGADAERDRAECAVRRGVAVATGNRHAGLGQTLLWRDDVHHALFARTRLEQTDAVVAAVFVDGDHHFFGQAVGVRPRLVFGRNDVIDGGNRTLGERDLQPFEAQISKGLG